jgi:hypothetical protein
MAINSRTALFEYAKKRLGAPLIEINVEDSQLDQLLDDTIQLYQDRVYDGTEEVFLKYVITQQDIDNKKNNSPVLNPNGLSFFENQNFLIIPDYIIGINDVFKTSSNFYHDIFGGSSEFFIMEQFNFFGGDILNLADIYLLRQSIHNINNILNPENTIKFNRNNGRLYIDFDIKTMLGRYIIIQCQRALDPAQFNKMYNDRFIKEYFTILVEELWGMNLSKFSNIKLPGGVMFNSEQILARASAKKEKFLAEMIQSWEEYPHFIVG